MSLRLFNNYSLFRYSFLRAYSNSYFKPLKICRPIAKCKFSTISRLHQVNKDQNEIRKEDDNISYKGNKQDRITDLEAIDKVLKADSISGAPLIRDNIYTIPNFLTLTRIATTPFIGYYLINKEPKMAMSIFIYSCVTDFVDGFIARKFNQKSALGSILDPMADKFLMTVCTLSMAYTHSIPTYLAILIIGRDIILSLMSLYYRYYTIPDPKTFKKFVDISTPTVSIHPTLLSKVNTALQMIYIGSAVLRPGIEALLATEHISSLNLFLSGFEIVVASTTVLSGLIYVFGKNAYKVISSKI